MSSRSYLSIGDVLTMLREEFPDVTISKIRFLESQGLVNPERSPSGYRKFFEADVERLRWVLRQQREHFLPLKVIRDRLAEGDVGDPVPAAAVTSNARAGHSNGKSGQTTGAAAPAPVAAGVGARSVGSGSGSGGAAGGAPASGDVHDDDQLTQADNDAMARILADASRRAASLNEASGDRPPLRIVEEGETQPAPLARPIPPAPVAAPPAVKPDRVVASAPASDGATEPPAVATVAPTPRTAASSVGAPVAASQPTRESPASQHPQSAPSAPAAESRRSATPASNTAAPAAPAPRPAPTASPGASGGTTMVTGASLSVEELCSASGLSEIEVAGLQGFGLIEGEMVAGILTFNEDALTVASLAASFRRFGIEPRHLRLYRNSVDRELGLIEQVIIPLLRQRNPESRQRAVEGADELAELGQTMRAALLRAALRQHLGG